MVSDFAYLVEPGGFGGSRSSGVPNIGESESTVDLQAEMYVSNILPDEATIVYPERGCVLAALCSDHSYASWEDPPTPPPQLRRGGRAHPPDERVVCKPQSGRWSSLLPVGTVVRRPSVKLVQLVAQAIHESPHRVLRVTQVYAALQNRYPYYRLLDTKSIRSWKSSVRNTLLRKWFMKLRPTSGMCETVRPGNFFWGLNYSKSPRDWQMPGGLPWLFLPTDDEGEQRGDEASTLSSGLHVNTEQPSKTTATLMPSAFRLELEYTLFAPPEPQSPGDKHKLSTLQCSELAPVTSAAQSEDDLVSVGSPPSSLPHIAPADLWKSPSMNPVGWPAPGRAEEQAWQQPSVSACAAPPSLWDGMYFQPEALLRPMPHE
ncbi:forkhead box protein G1-like [Dermacentor silvarum]|uniref:forkhead box protein G1-like n=1 Tax=Dermacentor silvarum TaxID=543639 RepID=UPI0021019EDA|nr:forkhead box protein G1-like [Dermacentor silvarum]